jgi:hypothetical protein
LLYTSYTHDLDAVKSFAVTGTQALAHGVPNAATKRSVPPPDPSGETLIGGAATGTLTRLADAATPVDYCAGGTLGEYGTQYRDQDGKLGAGYVGHFSSL